MPARARHDEQRIARRWAICAIASRSSEAIYATAAVSDGALLEGCVAYFLVHALPAGGSLAEEERLLAQNFADAARQAHAARIVYLGALVDAAEDGLFNHMASRVEVGRVLRGSGVQTIEFRASIVIGAGSFSFELIRRLVDCCP